MNVGNLTITPRYDINYTVVSFCYEVRTAAGVLSPTFDIYPLTATGAEFNALVGTFDFIGPSGTGETVEIDSDALPTDAAGWEDYFKEKFDWLGDPAKCANVQIFVAGGLPSPVLARELTEGQVPGWTGFQTRKETVGAFFIFDALDEDGAVVEECRNKWVSVKITTTDAEPGSYNRVTSLDSGDSIPTGLAQFIHSSTSVLHYEGTCKTGGEEVTGAIRPGVVLNIVNGQAAWATMRAVVQSVTEDIDAGEVSVTFGPPQHIGPQDIIELLRITRPRRIYTAPNAQTGADETPGTDLSGEDQDESRTHGPGRSKKQVFKYDR